jgi:hypothetical protein
LKGYTKRVVGRRREGEKGGENREERRTAAAIPALVLPEDLREGVTRG